MWLRYSDYFDAERGPWGALGLDRFVEYRCQQPHVIVDSIVVEEINQKAYLKIQAPTYHFHDRLKYFLQEIYGKEPDALQDLLRIIHIPFQTLEDYQLSLILLKKLNREQKIIIFDQEIIDELRLIFEYVSEKNTTKIYIHRIKLDEERIKKSEYYDRKIKERGSISDTVLNDEFFRRKNFNYKQLKKYLLWGENPNALDWEGHSAFYHAVGLGHKKTIELMLIYGADPFYRDHSYYTSPFDFATNLNFKEVIETIINYCSKFNYPIVSPRTWFEKLIFQKIHALANLKNPVRISKILFNEDNKTESNDYIIHYKFDNGVELKNLIKSSQKITDEEDELLWNEFKVGFYSYDKSIRIESIYKSEMQGLDTYIDLIYFNTMLIGYNNFQIKKIPKYKDTVILNCNLAQMNLDYRGTRLMTLLALRVGFALQQLYPDKEIPVYFTMLDIMGYRLFQSLIHWPMYQDDYTEELIIDIVNSDFMYNNKSGYYHKDSECHVRDPLKVNDAPKKNPKRSIHDDFYYKNILNYQDNEECKDKAVPFLFYVDEENLNRSENIIEKLGVNFKEHILSYTNYLGGLIGVKASRSDQVIVPRGSIFYSKRKRINGNEKNIIINDEAKIANSI